MKEEYIKKILAIKSEEDYDALIGDSMKTFSLLRKRLNEIDYMGVRKPVSIRMEPSLFLSLVVYIIPRNIFNDTVDEGVRRRFIETDRVFFKGYPVVEDDGITGFDIDCEDVPK